MAAVYIIWDRAARAAIPGCFNSSADAQAHADSLDKQESRSGKKTTKDVVGPVTI
jgi:hypothetical protein